MDSAACRSVPPGAWWSEHDPDVFFPERGRLDDVDKARWSCYVCPVKIQCKDYQESTKSEYGMWAGNFPVKKPTDDGSETWSETWWMYLDLIPERIVR